MEEGVTIRGYDKLNIKNLVGFILLTVVGYASIIVCLVNLSDNYKFYKNAKHTNGYLITQIKEEGKTNEVTARFGYKVGGKEYTYDLSCTTAEMQSYENSSEISLFYDKTNPKDCRTGTRSLVSIYMIIGLLFLIGSYGLFICVRDFIRISFNKSLIRKNNFVMADFKKITKRKSYYNTNRGIENYVVCEYNDGNQEYTFKSIVMYNDYGHYLKGKQLKVYVDGSNFSKYLVDVMYLNDIVEKEKKISK